MANYAYIQYIREIYKKMERDSKNNFGRNFQPTKEYTKYT